MFYVKLFLPYPRIEHNILIIKLSRKSVVFLESKKIIPYDRNFFNNKKNNRSTKYITISTDYRSSINIESILFKKFYSLRTESKRYKSH